jgi:hypothetical protein
MFATELKKTSDFKNLTNPNRKTIPTNLLYLGKHLKSKLSEKVLKKRKTPLEEKILEKFTTTLIPLDLSKEFDHPDNISIYSALTSYSQLKYAKYVIKNFTWQLFVLHMNPNLYESKLNTNQDKKQSPNTNLISELKSSNNSNNIKKIVEGPPQQFLQTQIKQKTIIMYS